MGSPTIVDRYEWSKLEAAFQTKIETDYKVKDVEVALTGSSLTDLDNDGAMNDLSGTAILKVGRSFKSFIFLLREDGSTKFLENNGTDFSPKKGAHVLTCDNKPIACPDTMERAKRQIWSSSFSVMEFDKKKPGLEIVIPLVGGALAVLNSLEVFLGN